MRQSALRKLSIDNWEPSRRDCQLTIVNSEAVWIGSSHPFDLHEAYLCFRSPAGWQLKERPHGPNC